MAQKNESYEKVCDDVCKKMDKRLKEYQKASVNAIVAHFNDMRKG